MAWNVVCPKSLALQSCTLAHPRPDNPKKNIHAHTETHTHTHTHTQTHTRMAERETHMAYPKQLITLPAL